MAYGSGIALLWQLAGWQRRLRPLAAMGRMALTNYLLQSVVATRLFYGYGLSLTQVRVSHRFRGRLERPARPPFEILEAP